MSVLATVLIAIAAAFIGFIIGIYIADYDGGYAYVYANAPYTEPPKNSEKTTNAEPPPVPAVTSKVVLPKRIKELEYNKRVNAALKEVIDKAVDVWVSGRSKAYKRQIANNLYHEWHVKIENTNYRNYNSNLQCICFVGRRVGSGFKFEAFWEAKDPKRDARRHK